MTPVLATASLLARIQAVPRSVWIDLAIAIGVLVGAVIVLRRIAKMNKVILGVIVVLILTFIGFNWIYERSEPAWATPVVSKLADFLPTKGAMK